MPESPRERDRPPEVKEWFESAEQQREASAVGMWLFLTSEVLLFGALFALYVAYRAMYSSDFAAATHHNNVAIGTVNTFILITSSFFVAWAVHAVRGSRRTTAVLCLLGATFIGAIFLTLKGIEYAQHFREGILPGRYYHFAELPGGGAKLFFTLYFFMTGLHALHVLGGMVLLSTLAWLVHREKIRAESHTLLENGGLYWHLVDVVWIFLWPMLYLVG